MSLVKDITGPGITSSISLEGTDLGIVREDTDRNALAVMFGDSFEFVGLKGEWRSPVIAMYDRDFKLLGIPDLNKGIRPNAMAKQLWNYEHNNPVFSTVLPTDFIRIGKAWYVHVMVTKGLFDPNIPGSGEVWTEFQVSQDLISWYHTNYILPNPNTRPMTMLSFDIWDEWVYIYCTAGLQRDKPIYLYRCQVKDFPLGYWHSWGWRLQTGWAWGNIATPVLEIPCGELCLRNRNGQAFLSYFCNEPGNRRVAVRVAQGPLSNWYDSPEKVIAHEREFPQLYGGYQGVDRKDVLVSQWNTRTNDPYKVMLFREPLL